MIEFESVTKTFPGTHGQAPVVAVDRLDLEIADGSLHCLLGTSGCGKTTTMRLANRLEEATAGIVRVGGRDVTSIDPIRLRRGIGYVVQRGGLFPHLTVEANIGLPCRLEKWSSQAIRGHCAELLATVGLDAETYAQRYPADLSGGQRQRVGIARALALDPAYLLMDEPFGALDPITRRHLHIELRPVLKSKTVLLVTHDLDEAFRLGDVVSVMHEGRVEQTGTPREVRDAPATAFVAEFVRSHTVETLDV